MKFYRRQSPVQENSQTQRRRQSTRQQRREKPGVLYFMNTTPTLSFERRRETTSHAAIGPEAKEVDETEASNFPQTLGEETAETKDPPLHQAENTAEATRRTSPELERRNKSFVAETPSAQRTSAATKEILAGEDTACAAVTEQEPSPDSPTGSSPESKATQPPAPKLQSSDEQAAAAARMEDDVPTD